jgi:hypothetical protein
MLGELFWGSADGPAVIGVGDFPENCVRISCVDAARVAERDVAVNLAVN